MNQNTDITQEKKESSNISQSFGRLTRLRTVFLEGGNLLIENDSILYSVFCFLFVMGLSFLFFPIILVELNIVFKILLGLFLIILASILALKMDYYSVLDSTDKSFHNEFRLGSLALYKSKKVFLSDIVEFGLDHQRKVGYSTHIPILLTSFFEVCLDIGYIKAKLKGKAFSPHKEGSKENDGMVEKSAIAYIDKDGKKNYLNAFSDRVDSDDINSELVEILGEYSEKHVLFTKPEQGLLVKRIGNKLNFEPYNLKPVTIGGDFATTILIFSVLFLIVLIIFILVYFEIL